MSWLPATVPGRTDFDRVFGLRPSLYDEMLRHFSPPEVVELTAGLALFMGFSKIGIVLGQAPESMPTTVLPTPDWPA